MADLVHDHRTAAAEVRGFTARAGGRTIVEPLSFRVGRGEVLALVGESGSGKTTTGLALLGEAMPGVVTAGSVAVDRDRVGYVPQHPGSVLTPSRRVGSVLTEIALARLRRAPRAGRRAAATALVRRAAERASLDPDLLSRFPHQLSGGQQQRVVLAQALIGDPVLLVADEPTTGLDLALRDAVVAEFADLVGQGLALVLLSHDLGIVRRLADRTVVLRGGVVVEQGPDVWTAPASPYTRRLLADADAAERLAGRAAPARAEAAPAALSVSGLEAGYRRGSPVLHGIDLEVAGGECLVIDGPSGAGKSTLGRCIAGLHLPTAGRLRLDGRPVRWPAGRRSRDDLARSQYVFQDARSSFEPFHPVGEQAARTAIRLRGLAAPDARRAAAAAFARVGLADGLLDRRVTELSGGELQRAALARALLAEPGVLVCDEVTTGLDPVTRSRLLDLLDELRRDGLALVMITHEPAVVGRLADRVLRLDPSSQRTGGDRRTV
ncbi:ABC transporter ATP-binding protein [Microlunatus sp. GCM10028923]|uniref:ABC transporter ATP-binding protein n=1 Tax=Microlunatus sp. GCM10028923 TaxID=3273400 RepID=UPI003620075D